MIEIISVVIQGVSNLWIVVYMLIILNVVIISLVSKY